MPRTREMTLEQAFEQAELAVKKTVTRPVNGANALIQILRNLDARLTALEGGGQEYAVTEDGKVEKVEETPDTGETLQADTPDNGSSDAGESINAIPVTELVDRGVSEHAVELLIAAGLETLPQVWERLEAGTLTDIDGIGSGTEKKVREALSGKTEE